MNLKNIIYNKNKRRVSFFVSVLFFKVTSCVIALTARYSLTFIVRYRFGTAIESNRSTPIESTQNEPPTTPIAGRNWKISYYQTLVASSKRNFRLKRENILWKIALMKHSKTQRRTFILRTQYSKFWRVILQEEEKCTKIRTQVLLLIESPLKTWGACMKFPIWKYDFQLSEMHAIKWFTHQWYSYSERTLLWLKMQNEFKKKNQMFYIIHHHVFKPGGSHRIAHKRRWEYNTEIEEICQNWVFFKIWELNGWEKDWLTWL